MGLSHALPCNDAGIGGGIYSRVRIRDSIISFSASLILPRVKFVF